ncbi:MAG: 50S ribosomal protein L18e [Methanosarcinaceae archaeon]|nr:50S ribosomal protein L18e [Methanosarcinaceae archaeon]
MGKKSKVKIERKTNPRISVLVKELKNASHAKNVLVWKDIAKRLEKPSRRHAEVNLSTINRHTSQNESVLIPGKVLGSGDMGHAVIIAALGFSESAKRKILDAGGNCISIETALNENMAGMRIIQ